MSEMGQVVGAIRVAVVPDTSQFSADLQKEMQSQQSVIASTAKSSGGLVEANKAQAASMVTLRNEAELLNDKYLVGLATVEQRDAAARKFALAQVAESEASIKLALATGQAVNAADRDIVVKARQIQETEQLAAATVQLGHAQRRTAAHVGEFDRVLRRVATGESPLSSLLSPGAIARFGVAGLAIGTVFSALGHLEEKLKATGDEAFTTEGKFRNFGAALVKGDLIGGIMALNAQQDKFKEALALTDPKVQQEALFKYGEDAKLASAKMDKLIEAQQKLGVGGSAMTQAIVRAQEKMNDQAQAGTALAKAMEIVGHSTITVADRLDLVSLRAQAAAAGIDGVTEAIDSLIEASSRVPINPAALTFDPATGAQSFGITDLSGARAQSKADNTNTLENQKAIAQANTRNDQQRLELAGKEVARTKKVLTDMKGETQGLTQAKLDYANAKKQEYDIGQGIEAKAASDSARAQSKAEQAAREAERLAKQREAERKKALAEAARRAKEDIDYRHSLIDLIVLKAEGTERKGDDEIAYRKEIAFWEREKKRLAKLGRAGRDGVVEAKKEIEQWQQKIKALKDDKSAAGASPEDFYRMAVDTFREYGGGGSFLSAQDVRGNLAGRVLGANTPTRAAPGRGASTGLGVERMVSTYQEHGQAQSRRDASLLIETRRQTVILRRIASNTGRSMKALQLAGENANKVKGA